jgi:signal peptide peptidase SppA
MPGAAKYWHILKAVCEQPWALQPATLAIIVDLVRFRAEGGVLDEEEIRARIGSARNGPRSGGGTQDQVAVIPVYGVLSQRQNLIGASSGGASVEGLTADFRAMLAEPSVGAIVFDIDSPGGAVDGIPELGDEIRAARGGKPIIGVTNTLAASAAYWLAAQCDELVCTPSGQVGSVGVYAVHQDFSVAMDKAGVATTYISAGEFKTEGNEFEPLTDEAHAALQDMVDQYYAMFVGAVAKGRGVPIDTVKSDYGKGRVLTAKRALSAGMIDRIDTLDATIARLSRDLSRNAGRAGAAAYSAGTAITIGPLAELDAEALNEHHTDTDDGPWDGPAEESKIPNSRGAGTFRRMYAWVDPDLDPDTKTAYKFLHHFWRSGVGAASTKACSAGIGVLNGARGGTKIPSADRQGVYDHLAAHLRDADMEPPEFNGQALSPALAAEIEYLLVQAEELGLPVSSN